MEFSACSTTDDVFKVIRNITGWVRPPGSHGCRPTEIISGLWTAHYHDIDSKEKLLSCGSKIPFKLVVNTAIRQCKPTTGCFGDDVEILNIDLEDDPDERKGFDAGKLSQSRCTDSNVPEIERCAGNAKQYFQSTSNKIDEILKKGEAVMIHCHASISRSSAFILAYMLQNGGFPNLFSAVNHMKKKWDALWPCDRFVMDLIDFERQCHSSSFMDHSLHITTAETVLNDQFKEIRNITGWVRPPGSHGCKATEIIKGLWTAHFHDVDSTEKLASAVGSMNMRCVVNTAIRQCESRQGTYGENVEVVLIDLEDDPDERKQFDAGKQSQSRCKDKNVPEMLRCAGDAKKNFRSVSQKINKVINENGGDVLVHCHASISRSAVFIIAYMLEYGGFLGSLPSAVAHMKAKWEATWPCDRFVMQLIEFDEELREMKINK